MKKHFTILLLVAQVILTFVMMGTVYMIYALLDSELALDSLFGLVLVHPLMAIVLSFLTICLCLPAGLPIRFNKKANTWWVAHFYLPIAGAALGLVFLGLALLPAFQETTMVIIDGVETSKQVPKTTLVIPAWFLTAFCLLHLYPPAAIIRKLKGGIFILDLWRKIKR